MKRGGPLNPKEKKTQLRKRLSQELKQLGVQRREEAQKTLLAQLPQAFPSPTSLLSFSSFRQEIDTHPLNAHLAREGRLLLPRVHQDQLQIFAVSHPESQLRRSPWGILEPDPSLCPLFAPSSLQVILVPGLGFDSHHQRLGYGKGFYDRLLASAPQAHTIGVGFHEQKLSFSLPVESWDHPLDQLALF